MVRCFTGDLGSRTYSYDGAEFDSLEAAIVRASVGELPPDELLSHMPVLKEEVERLASAIFSRAFLSLDQDQQKAVIRACGEKIREAKPRQRTALRVLEGLELAKAGGKSHKSLYKMLPQELRGVLDSLAGVRNVARFLDCNDKMRAEILGVLLDLLREATKKEVAEAERRGGAEKAKKDAQEKAAGESEERKQRQARIEAQRKEARRCVLCGEPLGFVNRILRRTQHSGCTKWRE